MLGGVGADEVVDSNLTLAELSSCHGASFSL